MSGPKPWPSRRQPLTHRAVRAWARAGFRGSSLLWRVAYKLQTPRPGWFRFADGCVALHNPEDWTSRSFYEGTYEPHVIDLLAQLAPRLGTYIDVGANIGVTLAQVSANSPQSARLWAFEPSPRCVAILDDLKERLDQSVVIVPKAVGGSVGHGLLTGQQETSHWGLGRVAPDSPLADQDALEVSITTIDACLTDTAERPMVIKVDTEGGEKEVLLGMASTLREARQLVLLVEISPEFGDTSWVSEFIRDQTATGSCFRVQESTRPFRRNWQLVPTDGCPLPERQWTLVVVRGWERSHGFG